MATVAEATTLLLNNDTKDKIAGASALIDILRSGEFVDVDLYDVLDSVVDNLILMNKSSNHKVCVTALEAFEALAEVVPEEQFAAFANGFISHLIERFGDSKAPVRDQAIKVALSFERFFSLQGLVESFKPALEHKIGRVRETMMTMLTQIYADEGTRVLPKASPLLPAICKSLEDREQGVRDAASALIVEMYTRFGHRLREDVLNRISTSLPKSRIDALVALLDAAQLPEDDDSSFHNSSSSRPDSGRSTPSSSLGGSLKPPMKRSSSLNNSASLNGSGPQSQVASKDDGLLLTTAEFENFDDCEPRVMNSERELSDEISKLCAIAGDANKEWDDRVKALKRFRGVMNGGAVEMANFPTLLPELKNPLLVSIKDLRSQVLRDGCITISQLAHILGTRLESLVVLFMPVLLKHTYGSVKIMAQSADQCIRQVIIHCPSPKIIPIITEQQTTSKSSILRTNCAEYLEIAIRDWDTARLEKIAPVIDATIRKGLGDPDASCRSASRRAYWAYHRHFELKARAIAQGLDASAKKLLEEEGVRYKNSSAERSSGFGSSSRLSSSSSQPPSTSSARTTSAGSSVLKPLKLSVQPTPATTSSASGGLSSNPLRSPPHGSATSVLSKSNSSGPDSSLTTSVKAQRVQSRIHGATSASAASSTGAPSITSIPTTNTGGGPRRVAPRVSASGEEAPEISEKSNLRPPVSSIARPVSTSNGRVPGLPPSAAKAAANPISTQEQLAKSAHWEVRERCFQQLPSFCATADLNRLMTLSAQGFMDAQPRVAVAAVNSAREILMQSGNSIEIENIQPVVDNVFHSWRADLAENVSTSIDMLVDALEKVYPPTDLFYAALKVLLHPSRASELTLAAKGYLLEFMSSLLHEVPPEDISNDATFCLGVQKIVALTAEPKSETIRKDAESVIYALWQANDQVVQEIFSVMPQSLASSARTIIASRSADGRRALSASSNGAYNATSYEDDGISEAKRSLSSSAGPKVSASAERVGFAPPPVPVVDQLIETISTAADENGKEVEDALLRVIRCCKEKEQEDVLGQRVSELVEVILQVFASERSGVREKGARALRELVRVYGGAFNSQAEAVVDRLMDLHNDENRETLRAAEECLNTLILALPPSHALDILQPFVRSPEVSKMLAAIKLETRVFPLISPAEMEEMLPLCLPPLIAAYRHEMAEVRKASVFSLVELYLNQGDSLTQHLSELSSQQMKLLNIYLNRALAANQQA